MAYTISDLKVDMEGMLQGTSLDQVTGVDVLINRAARKLLLDLDAQETKRIAQITTPIFSQVYEYPLPSDLKGNCIIDIRPQVNQTPYNKFAQEYVKEFELYKKRARNAFNIKFNNGLKTLRLQTRITLDATVISQINDTTGWSGSADVSNIQENNLNFVAGGSSLQFDDSGVTGTAYIENSSLQPVDISSLSVYGSFFLYVFIPNNLEDDVTSVNVRIGSSIADYLTLSVSAQQDGTSFQNGWNLLRFNIPSMTQVGTVDDTAIDYARITINSTVGVALNGILLNNLTAQLGVIFDMEYYSKYMFRTSAGVWQERVTADTNIINLDVESQNIFLNMCVELASQQISGSMPSFNVGYFETKYQEDIRRYKQRYPSEIIVPVMYYYRFPQRGMNRKRIYNSG